jgi:hypothetical protein
MVKPSFQNRQKYRISKVKNHEFDPKIDIRHLKYSEITCKITQKLLGNASKQSTAFLDIFTNFYPIFLQFLVKNDLKWSKIDIFGHF